MVFSANVRQQDIDFISVGNSAKITLDGKSGQVITGVVDKIYPEKTFFQPEKVSIGLILKPTV